MLLFTKIFHFITLSSIQYKIDESHSIMHSMNTLIHASNILREEMPNKPSLKNQEQIIHTSALLHDMIDRKYVEPKSAMLRLRSHFREDFTRIEMDAIEKIITTCSYSKVKQEGFPNLGEYQLAYHIVREADLLGSYDFDRTLTYMIRKHEKPFEEAYLESCNFFQYRVFKYIDDGLFFTSYSQRIAPKLQDDAIKRIWMWKYLYHIYAETI